MRLEVSTLLIYGSEFRDPRRSTLSNLNRVWVSIEKKESPNKPLVICYLGRL